MPPDAGLPPELAALSREEFRAVYAAAARLALALMRRKDAADKLTSDAFEALLTTRRWDPARGPLLDHLCWILKSIRSNTFTSKAPVREADVRHAFQREELGTEAASPEDKHLENAAREIAARGAEGELEVLAKSVAGHPLALRVLESRRGATNEGTKKKAADVAAELGVPVSEVYKANDVLREHLRAIRKRVAADDDGGAEGGEEA